MGAGLAIDANNNVFFAMRMLGSANMGGVSITSAGGFDVGLAKLSSTGTTVWARAWGAAGNDIPRGIAVDASGNCYVAGQFTDTASSYLAKFSASNGSLLMTKAALGATAYGVAIHQATGDIAVTGSSSGTVNFGGASLTTAGPAAFLVLYNPSGSHLWSATYGGNSTLSTDYGMGVCFDASGNVALTGQILSSVDFGGGWLFGNGNVNFFAASFTHAGNYRWGKRASGSTYSIGYGIGCGPSGQVVAGGFHRYNTDFGGLSAAAPTGNDDGFVVQYAP